MKTRLDRTNAVHHVYRCFDETGQLIYVGSTANLFGRLDQHRRASWWAGQVVSVSAKVFPNGTAAREHERRAIQTEAPRWNKAHRWATRHEWTRDQWDDWLTMLIRRKTFPAEMRRFINLYRRTWEAEPAAALVEAVVAAEQAFEQDRLERARLSAEQRARMEEVQREDELALRRERKAAAAKVRRLTKKTKKAKAALRELELVQP